jgi:hypothetical protein
MFRTKKHVASVSIAREALESIFDECDMYNADETGGRLIGTYRTKGTEYQIDVTAVIGPGPRAQRTATSFFQDGEYQEQEFRSIEAEHPEIEHLGNWHTHHVNGYPTLSGGDKTTYFNIVNHKNHNTDFFYALLVVHKNAGGAPRYDVNHYLFRRNDSAVYEIPSNHVRVVDAPILSARRAISPQAATAHQTTRSTSSQNAERPKDQAFFSEFYPLFRPLYSESMGAPYWKGPLNLVDGSRVEVVAMEYEGDGKPHYAIAVSGGNKTSTGVAEGLKDRKFQGARHAVHHLEKALNQAAYNEKK